MPRPEVREMLTEAPSTGWPWEFRTVTVIGALPPEATAGIGAEVYLIGGAVVGTGAAGGIYVGLRRRGRKKP